MSSRQALADALQQLLNQGNYAEAYRLAFSGLDDIGASSLGTTQTDLGYFRNWLFMASLINAPGGSLSGDGPAVSGLGLALKSFVFQSNSTAYQLNHSPYSRPLDWAANQRGSNELARDAITILIEQLRSGESLSFDPIFEQKARRAL